MRDCCKTMSNVLQPMIHIKLLVVLFVVLCTTTLPVVGVPGERPHQFDFRCFPHTDNAKYPRFASSNRDPISLQVTSRVTHQLLSRIFAIFLREVLFYENVNLIEKPQFPEQNEHHRLFLSLLPLSSRVVWPEPTVDLEVWMLPDFHVIPDQVRDAGAVTSSGRFGWFIPKKFIDKTQPITYRDFQGTAQDAGKTSFRLANGVLEEILPKAEKFCDFNGTMATKCFYSPAHCTRRECSLMVAPDFDTTGFIIHHIEEFKFNVQVLFLGGNFTEVLNGLLAAGSSKFLVLHWTPSDAIDGNTEEFEAVVMPKCENIESSSVTGCKYELTPLLKFYAQQLQSADYAIVALNKFYFPRGALQSLLKNYTHVQHGGKLMSDVLNHVACSWMKTNEEIFQKWIPVREPKEDIYIGGIFPITKANSIHKCLPDASRLAADDVNAVEDILPNHRLVVQRQDGQCRTDAVMKAFINYYMRWERVIGILGPACSETVEPIAGVSKHFRMGVISYSAEGVSFTDRTTYPYFFRTIGENHQFQEVYLNFFRHMKWRRVAAITVDGQKYTGYISHMETMLKANYIELAVNKKLSHSPSPSSVHQVLQDLKTTTRILIADVDDAVAKILLCEAFKLHMTAKNGYVWFLPVWLEKRKILSENSTIDCTDRDLLEAFNGHFSLSYAPFGEDDQVISTLNTSVSQWQSQFHKVCPSDTPYSYVGYTYDAVWVYAYALDQLIKENSTYLSDLHSERTTKRFMEIIWNTDFMGVSGRVKFSDGGSRFLPINIIQWFGNSSRIVGVSHPNASLDYGDSQDGTFYLDESLIVWLSPLGRPTDGVVFCGLHLLAEVLNSDCETINIIAISLACFVIVVLVFLASFIFWRKQYNRKMKLSARYMRSFGIDFMSTAGVPDPGNSLDKWEVAKERIIVNRKLGEGAFGTVYGGEMLVAENTWIAVAVKTLKSGSSVEDRLDFLSEAEAMKRFDHENVIKLLGVCLKSEPIYTILEFMLYGDLKTFLLARRHLVKNRQNDESDVSSRRLTMMAMDVARGLSYLASQKFVHRDVACRNCLVNAQRVVKLADFGMARPTFDNDYYKFNRKGLLPIRWMSPESLGLGLFTPASDIWSYGILLYEILTCGSFPYQGLNNMQVLEHVKAGKILKIPPRVKPQLRHLMHRCWVLDYKKRPTAPEIVEYISNHPRLIIPCLDVPTSSVGTMEPHSYIGNISGSISAKRANEMMTFNDFSTLNRRFNRRFRGMRGRLKECNPIEPLLSIQEESMESIPNECNMRRYVSMDELAKSRSSLSTSDI
ncbi:atrial natriuretic peptide receptor 2-like [Lutzomyia longipalpis]|uniref:atrial natriuretic peptide receptor 2-like n=1 Tax=Lutzomyia longipalpis TaxID=7200 RepID=UPI00248382A9|nr:atrial natriuretic peptide receptor 2-like [Lutzomyia longipalpis]XP_055681419.1 atrial natriuretic peptide receptor 2-like [Lutzomyia longipalpis]